MPPIKCGIGYYSEKLLASLSDKAQVNILTTEGCDIFRNTPTSYVKNWKITSLYSIYRYCKNAKADCFIIQYPARGYKRNLGINILPYIIRYLIKKPLLVTLHEYHGSGMLGRLRNFITVLPSNKVFVSNIYDLRTIPILIRRKSVVVPIGSNIERLKTSAGLYKKIILNNNFTKDNKIGVFFGFPNPNKGLDLLIESVYKSKSQLIIIAELDENNQYHMNLKNKIKKMRSIGAHIYVTGYLNDKEVSSILERADYFVLPQPLPLTAKSGTAIAAAIHCLPIISTGGNDKDINAPYVSGVNSILIEDMNIDSLGIALENINSGKIDLIPISQNLKKVASFFEWEIISNKYIKEIKEMTNG